MTDFFETVNNESNTSAIMASCCNIQTALFSMAERPHVTISEVAAVSTKTSVYYNYLILFQNYSVHRRYSEFISLQHLLTKIHQTNIVPPLPDKHSLKHFVTKSKNLSKIEQDEFLNKRKRMLEAFLNKILQNKDLSNEHLFHKFLEAGVSWNEVINGPTIKLKLQSSSYFSNGSINETEGTSFNNNEDPNLLKQIKTNPEWKESHFAKSIEFTNKFNKDINKINIITNNFTKNLKKKGKAYVELGALYNAFSINEDNKLGVLIEKLGQSYDNEHIAINRLTTDLQIKVLEPIEQYVKYSPIIKQVINNHEYIRIQGWKIKQDLEKKQNTLEALEVVDKQGKLLDEALEQETNQNEFSDDNSEFTENGINNANSSDLLPIEGTLSTSPYKNNETRRNSQPHSIQKHNPNVTTNEQNSTKTNRARVSIMDKLSYSIHNIIDMDPQATRKSKISKTKDDIIKLEQKLLAINEEIEHSKEKIQENLNAYQGLKEKDLKTIIKQFAKAHISYCEKNIRIWQETVDYIKENK